MRRISELAIVNRQIYKVIGCHVIISKASLAWLGDDTRRVVFTQLDYLQ